MLQRLSRMGRPEPLPDAPTVDDFTALGLDAETAAAALQHLAQEHAAERLDWYRRMFDHDWLIWLPDSVVRGGRRLELATWALEWLLHQQGGAQ